MKLQEMTSRERYLSSFNFREPDRVPVLLDCLPVAFYTPEIRWYNQFEKAQKLLSLNCDPMIDIWLPDPVPTREVSVRTWREKDSNGGILLGKEFITPKGNLRQVVRETSDWTNSDHEYWVRRTLGSGEKQSYGMDVFDDWNISRRTEPWIKGPEDLPKLRYVLGIPEKWQLDEWRYDTQRAMEFAKKHGLLTFVRRTILTDAAFWFCDIPWFLMQFYDDPGFVEEFLALFEEIAGWQAELSLEMNPDVLQRRGWYDTPEYWGGPYFKKYILPSINKEARLAHEAGALHCYLLTEGWGPYLEDFKTIDTDIIWGLDPYRGKASFEKVKSVLSGKKSVIGGISNEQDLVCGTPESVRKAVRYALETMAPGGGFVLGASASVQRFVKWENIAAWIDEAGSAGRYIREGQGRIR